MSRKRRFYPSKSVYFVTNRTSYGLPFVANLYITVMLFGVIARARHLYPQVKVCSWLFLQNHYHGLVLLLGTPDDFRNFMNYIDGEIAKLVVRWRGTRNQGVWASRYDAIQILTWDSVIDQMTYIFSNPIAALFVDKACDWFGPSTFYAFNDPIPRLFRYVRPRFATKLPNGKFSKTLVSKLMAKLDTIDLPSYTLDVSPFAWISCFPEAERMGETKIREIFFERLGRIEIEERQLRTAKKQTIIPREKIEAQNPQKAFTPTTFGERAYCVSSCPKIRAEFIAAYRCFCEMSSRAYRYAVENFLSLKLPPGGFAPTLPSRVSLLPVFEFP